MNLSSMPMFPTFLTPGGAWDGTPPSQVFVKNHEATQAVEATAADGSPDTLSRLVDLLDDHGEDAYGTLDPTQFAFRSSYRLIEKAEKKSAVAVAGSPTVDSLGGIRITWKFAHREIRLVVPSSRDKHMYLYQQSDDRHNTIPEITPEILADKLSWLIVGDNL